MPRAVLESYILYVIYVNIKEGGMGGVSECNCNEPTHVLDREISEVSPSPSPLVGINTGFIYKNSEHINRTGSSLLNEDIVI